MSASSKKLEWRRRLRSAHSLRLVPLLPRAFLCCLHILGGLLFCEGETAWAEAELSRDGGPFRHIWTGRGRPEGPERAIPIRLGRCGRCRLRLRGEGPCVLRELERETR